MRKRGKILLGILGVMVLALLALQTPVLSATRGRVWDSWVALLARISSLPSLALSADVMTQLQELQAENIRLKAELKRYARLELQLGETSFRQFTRIGALVGAQPTDVFRAHYFLNRGTEDGVMVGAPVVTQGSVLVGVVTEVASHSSVFRLLFHPATTVPVEVTPREGEEGTTRGLVQGQFYTSILLTTVPRDRQLDPGSAIVTHASEADVPHGLLVGMVREKTGSEQDAYQSASIDLPYDPDALEAVAILVPSRL